MYKSLIDSSLFVVSENNTVTEKAVKHRLSQHSMYHLSPSISIMQYLLWAVFGGAERRFWQQSGVYVTAVGYAGGHTLKPSYEEVCSGLTGHAEAVLVVFDPAQISFADLLQVFWQSHDPTQGMRQGNDMGSQYRSAIYCMDQQQLDQAQASCAHYQVRLTAEGGALRSQQKSLWLQCFIMPRPCISST